ncbi:hypothetical protein RUM43_001411 [Polyplax serrata]|uniref:Uncharacterized protein n=1 Tax=Polyplax serrata TaxID=468196 RepID=A0AAN8SE20_POLSC
MCEVLPDASRKPHTEKDHQRTLTAQMTENPFGMQESGRPYLSKIKKKMTVAGKPHIGWL